MAAEQGRNFGRDGPEAISGAPLRKTSVSGSAKVPDWESWKTLVSVTAYHSFGGEAKASNTPRHAALPLNAVTNFANSFFAAASAGGWSMAWTLHVRR